MTERARRLTALATHRVMRARSDHPDFTALVDSGFATAGEADRVGRCTFTITDRGAQVARDLRRK